MEKCNNIVTGKMAANRFIVNKYTWLFVFSFISTETALCSRLSMQQYQTAVMNRPSGQMPCVYGFFPLCKLDSQYCSNKEKRCMNYFNETEAVDSGIKRCLMEVETNTGETVREKGALDVCNYFLGKNAKMLIQNSQQWCKKNEFYNFTTWQCELIFPPGLSVEEKRLKCETLNNITAPKEILVACNDFLLKLATTLDKSLSQHKCLLKGKGMYFNETTDQCVPVFPKNASENEQLLFCESLNSDPDHMEVVSVCNKFLLEYVKKPKAQSYQGEMWWLDIIVIAMVGAFALIVGVVKVWENRHLIIIKCNGEVLQNQPQRSYEQVPLAESPVVVGEHDRNVLTRRQVQNMERSNTDAEPL